MAGTGATTHVDRPETEAPRRARRTARPLPDLIVGVAYVNPDASIEARARIRRYLAARARGRYQIGQLDGYTVIEFDLIDDLAALRRSFPRLVDGYKDLSGCPEPASPPDDRPMFPPRNILRNRRETRTR